MSILNGTPGDDTLTGTADNDTFNGFAGIDTAQIASAGTGSTFSLDSDGRWVVSGPQGTDTLDSIEAVQFSDGNVALRSGSGEFRVNTTTEGDQFHPAMTALSDGGFLIAWATTQDILIQRFDSAGVATGSEVKLEIIPTSPHETPERNPDGLAVAELVGGGYVVTWSALHPPLGANDSIIHVQAFDETGAIVGEQAVLTAGVFPYPDAGAVIDSRPSVTPLGDGGYLVTWQAYHVLSPEFPSIHGQRFDGNGVKVGSQGELIAPDRGAWELDAAAMADGGYVLAWMDGDARVCAQRFTSDGVMNGSEIPVGAASGVSGDAIAVAGLDDGGFVVVWPSQDAGGDWDIQAQRFDSTGAAVGGQAQVVTTGAFQAEPDIVALRDGGYVVTWLTSAAYGPWDFDIGAQRFDSTGAPVGDEIRVNTTTADLQVEPVVAALDEGGFVVGWSSLAQDGSGFGVYAQRFDSEGAFIGGYTLEGDSSSNSLHFVGAQPVKLIGNGGDDVLQGGSGDDLLDGGDGVDTVVVADAHDSLTWQLDLARALHTSGPGSGSDTLQSIERVDAAGASIDVSLDANTEVRIHGGYGPAITGLSDGGYEVVWVSQDEDGSGIYSQRFDATGTKVGSETLVNTTVLNSQNEPDIARLSDGGYAVTWSGDGIFAQRFDGTGTPVGSETQVNTTTAYNHDASITALNQGGFVVTWELYGLTAPLVGGGIYAQRFDGTGAKVGSETLVNAFTSAAGKHDPAVTALLDGGYLVTWTSFFQDGNGDGVYSQRFDASGAKVGGETLVNTVTDGSQNEPTVAGLDDGGYVVAWTSNQQGYDIYAQRYDSAGARVGTETLVNTTTLNTQSDPTVTALADGGYVVAWLSGEQLYTGAIHAQRFDSTGAAVGPETLVNTTETGGQVLHDVAALEDGGYVVTWMSAGQDGSGYGIYSQRFDANNLREGHLTLTGGAEDNVLRVTSAPEGVELIGGPGHDTLAGAGFWDVLTGGTEGDRFEFAASGNGVDLITDWGSGDRITITGASFGGAVASGTGDSVGLNTVEASTTSGVTTLYVGTDAAPGADVVIRLSGSFDPGSFVLDGQSIWMPDAILRGRGSLVGGPGDDFLVAEGGITRMEGGPGNDTYVIGNPNDLLVEQGNGGVDEVRSEWRYTLGANLENLVLIGERSIAGTGNELDNEITGNSARNVLTGGWGADTLVGGAGADLFVYTSIDDSGPAPGAWDILPDFNSADRDQIDLTQIDADPSSPGKQGFSFIGEDAFGTDATGQLRFDAATQMLHASIDADTDAEMAIQVMGVPSLGAQDFNL